MSASPLGVMQGRLLPKYRGRYQAHPCGYWQDEFPLAAGLGLASIEFIVDFEDADQNPLMRDSGPDEILALCEKTGVAVKSVCADYFMDSPLHGVDEGSARASTQALSRLMRNCARVGIEDIVIPCVDRSRMKDRADRAEFSTRLLPLVESAAKSRLRLSLETDLAPEPFAELLHGLDPAVVTVNYDMGNSASLGYDAAQEFAAYGARISDVHIKDRTLGGGSVPLGTGAVDFQKVFNLLASSSYRGPLIMQAFRDDEGLAVFKRQLDWIRPFAAQCAQETRQA